MSTHSVTSTRHADGDLLRLALTADAATTGTMGLAFVVASPLLDSCRLGRLRRDPVRRAPARMSR